MLYLNYIRYQLSNDYSFIKLYISVYTFYEKTYCRLYLLTLLLTACTKRDSQISYRIAVTPVTLDNLKNSTDTSFFSFTSIVKVPENISFFISGLPQGVTIDSSQVTGGTPPFNTIVILKNDGTAQAGTYDLKVNCIGAVTHSFDSYDLPLVVLPAPTGSNCLARISGTWLRCQIDTGTYTYIDQIAAATGVSNQVIFGNGNNLGFPLSANLYCSNDSLSFVHIIRVDASGWHYFSGSGMFSGNLIKYQFQDSMVTNVQHYTITMRR